MRSGEEITEIYEVKTSLDRQSLYTAIGQLIAHSGSADPAPKRILVIPKGVMPIDLQRCLASLQVKIRHFTLTHGLDPQVVLF